MNSVEIEKKLIHKMILFYCKSHHDADDGVCDECRALEDYAEKKIEHCPLHDSKIPCSRCRIHCYKEPERSRIREVMRFSGPKIFIRAPILTLQYFFIKR